MVLGGKFLVWKKGGPSQPQEDEDMPDFNFSNLPQLSPPPVHLSLDERVTQLEDIVTRGFQHIKEK